jgi:hypothetical protein
MSERLDTEAREGTEDVRTRQPISEQAFEDLKHRLPVTTGSGALMSFFRKNHCLCHLAGGLDTEN